MKTVLVFFGGDAPEHDISIITGVLTLNSIDKFKYNPIPVYITSEGEWYTGEILNDVEFYKKHDIKKLKKVTLIGGDKTLYEIRKNKLRKIESVSVAINCMHGQNGEDGSLKGLLNYSYIPLVGSDIMPSAVAMDKEISKIIFRSLKIKTAPYVRYKDDESLDIAEQKIGYPMIIKPCTLGSSIGISKADNRNNLEKAIAFAGKYDDKIIIEKFLENRKEINVAVYKVQNGIFVSLCESPKTNETLLSFEDKYVGGEKEFPANISGVLSERIRKIARELYIKLGFSGIIRLDFIISNNEVYINEINSVPGSMAYYLFSENIKGFMFMLTELIETAMYEYNKSSNKIRKFKCNILEIKGSKSCKNR